MDEAELHVELSRIRERSRRDYWRNWLMRFLPLYTALVVVFRLTDRDRHDSVWSAVLGIAVGAVIVGVVGFVATRRRWRLLPAPPLSAGLPRPLRRVVGRDLRRGTPSADPVLRAVEDAVAEKYRRSGPATVWLCAIFAVVFVLYAAFGDDVVAVRVTSVVGAVIMVAAGVQQLLLNRGLRAFG